MILVCLEMVSYIFVLWQTKFPSNHFGVPVINIQDLNSSLYVTQNNYVLNLES